ncbi:MAG: T9SS type A sorting domain-containing protein [Flavobacteriia bacterium]|nr:T9SS type A sorting domain-containing protein [Flavobacteriia bacterium]
MKQPYFKLALLALITLPNFMFSQNRALNFDGADDYVFSNYSGVSGSSARTVEAWIRTTANCNPNNGGVQNVIVDFGTFTVDNRFTLNLLWNNSIRLEIGGSGVSGTTPVNDGQWHHVAVTYDPTQSSNNIVLYIDGSVETSGTLTGVNTTTSNSNLLIGQRLDLSRPFNGDIDEVRVWDVALSANQISSHVNGEVCTNDPNLKLYYKFNQGIPGGNNSNVGTVLDEYGNNAGYLTNFAQSGTSSNWILGNASLAGGYVMQDSISGCQRVTLPNSGLVITNSGVYDDTLQTVNGCDSIIEYTVAIQSVDTAVSANGATLSAASNLDNYQWIDCGNGGTAISGETSSQFTATANGDYAVIVTANGCTDTSSCVSVTGIGMAEIETEGFRVYPNPSKNGTLQIETAMHSASGRIVGMDGIVHLTFDVESGHKSIQHNLTPGSYILELTTGDQTHTKLILVQ